MKSFDNRTVIVTGDTRGMGASHARGFVAEGTNVPGTCSSRRDGRSPTSSEVKQSSPASTSRATGTGRRRLARQLEGA